MSKDDVDTIRRLVVAFNARDVEDFAAITTADFEWSTSVMAVEGEVFWGRAGIETYFERMREAWEEFQAWIDEYRDLGDRVLVSGRVEGRGRGCGASVVAPLDILYEFRDGTVCRMHSFLDHDEALRAAGLAEE